MSGYLFYLILTLNVFTICVAFERNILNAGQRRLTAYKPAIFGQTYNGSVSIGKDESYEYRYNVNNTKKQSAIRVWSTSPKSDSSFPVIIVVREERSVMSWQIPLILENSYEYKEVSRTLCPWNRSQIQPLADRQTIFIEMSSQSNTSVPYSLKADILEDFIIQTKQTKNVTVSPAMPVYQMYTFSKGVESVLVLARSKDEKCAVFSIQDTKCPVYDLGKDVKYKGKYQTMTKQGSMIIDKSDFGNSFFIVLVVNSHDIDCTGGMTKINPAGHHRDKTFTITVKETLPKSEYYKATLAAALVFIAFYIVAALIGIFYHGCKDNWGIVDLRAFERSMSSDPEHSRNLQSQIHAVRNHGYGTLDESGQQASGSETRPNVMVNNTEVDDVSVDSDEFDFMKDAAHDKDVVRTKTALFVCDLAQKSEKRTEKNYRLYCTNLFTISVFYGLPVIQLVLTYQKVLNFTGDQDICYYNFNCANPLGLVSSFNNIYSNIGYVMLGILFLILVKRRSVLHRKAVERSEGRDKMVGIPQHFGLFYAMGMALCMEGFMSGCYHVCPTVSNFQFDTSFMYIMACLCILKIYQNRHPDISAKSHSAYLVMAIIIIVAVTGVVYGTNIFWIIFAFLYMTASLVLSVHLYYMGRWRLDRTIFKRIWLLARTDWCSCSRPIYLNRMILLIIGNIVNWSIALYGATTDSHPDFASYLLGIFIGNLLLYTAFYIVSKRWVKEPIPWLTYAYIIISMITWGFALWFFTANLTSWQLSPAISREGNQECALMGFYDRHDIWHFLSAISLFFSFLVLLTLDDEIILKRRDQIPVF